MIPCQGAGSDPEAPFLPASKALSSSSAFVGRGLLPSDPTEPLLNQLPPDCPVSPFLQWFLSPCHPGLSPTLVPALPLPPPQPPHSSSIPLLFLPGPTPTGLISHLDDCNCLITDRWSPDYAPSSETPSFFLPFQEDQAQPPYFQHACPLMMRPPFGELGPSVGRVQCPQ